MTDETTLLDKNPEDVIIEGDLAEYEQGMNFFYFQLVELHTNIYITEKVLSFPFLLFAGPENFFFRQVIVNFFDASVLMVTRIATDQGNDLFTLNRFKNRIREMIKPEYQQEFQKCLKENKFDEKTNEILGRAVELRVRRIAHFRLDFVQDFSEKNLENEGLSFSGLKTLRDGLNMLFNALSFNRHYRMLPISYDGSTSDIEKLLDEIARKSRRLNMPEQSPDWWRDYERPSLTENQLSQINQYRSKFGLSEVE